MKTFKTLLAIAALLLCITGCKNDKDPKLADTPQDCVPGLFSVSDVDYVYFAKGNIQYCPGKNEWRFAPGQLAYQGLINQLYYHDSLPDNEYIDLFAWSTEGDNFGMDTINDNKHYEGKFIDWATNFGTQWRTPKNNEIRYILKYRKNASQLRLVACVGETNGLILLPDNWETPEGMTLNFNLQEQNSSNGDLGNMAELNTLSMDQWAEMEKRGAVFLPASDAWQIGALRNLSEIGEIGYYWTAGMENVASRYLLGFAATKIDVVKYTDMYIQCYCVRLVQDAVKK